MTAARITDLATLTATAQRWLVRDGIVDEVIDELPVCVQLAEQVLWKELRVWQMQQRARATIAADGTVYLPEDYLAARYVGVFNPNGTLAGKVTILNSDAWLDVQNSTGPAPRYGIIRSHRLWLAPLPSSGQLVELDYYAEQPGLGSKGIDGTEVTVNEILTHYPNLYLFGTLSQAGDFARDETVRDRWAGRFGGELQSANRAGIASAVGPTPSIRMPR